MRGNKVYCDKCDKRFKIKVRKQKLKNGVERIYFACPRCKEEYTSHYTNEKIRNMQHKIKWLRQEYQKATNKKVSDGIIFLNQINRIKKEIGEEMDYLKKANLR